MLNSSQQVLAGDGVHPDIGVERLAGSGEHVRQHAVHDQVVGLVEKGERHPAVAVDQHGCGGPRWVRLEHHPIRVDDVVALGRVGEHQLVAVFSGRRRRAAANNPVGDVAHRRHHGVRLGIARAEQRAGVDLDPLQRSTGRCMPKTSPTVGLPDVMHRRPGRSSTATATPCSSTMSHASPGGVHSGQVLHVQAEDLGGGAVDGQHLAEAILDEHAFAERLDDTAVVVAAPQQIGVRLSCRLDQPATSREPTVEMSLEMKR